MTAKASNADPVHIAADLETLAVPIDSLDRLPGNPRRGVVDAVAQSYATFGQRKPLVARRTADGRGTVIAGNHQLDAARQLGWDRIAVVWTDDDDATAEAFALADNRTADLGDYDNELLLAMVDRVGAADAALLAAAAFTPADVEALRRLVEDSRPREALTDPDAVPDPPAVPVTQPGDVWQLGPHRLICGDSTDPDVVARLMAGGTAAVMVTDPPYGVDYGELVGSRVNQKQGGWKPIAGDALDDDALRELLSLSLAGAGAVVAFVCPRAGARRRLFWEALELNGWRIAQEIVWVKNALVFGRADYQWRHEPCIYAKQAGAPKQGDRTQTTVWEAPKPSSSVHPTQKPVAVFAPSVVNHSRPGDTIFDPFAGSGTTLIACHQEGRVARLVELEPVYCDVIVRRWEEHTGGTAERVAD